MTSARKLGSYLNDAQSPLKGLAQQAQRLLALSRIWESIAPPELARSCRVGRFDDGVLTLYADNGSVAAKIKNLAPRLRAQFKGRGCDITAIAVEVQVNLRSASGRPAPKLGVTPRAIAALARLAKDLPESELKRALTNFIRHQSAQHDASDDERGDENEKRDD